MKTIIVTAMFFMSTVALANSGVLDGRAYCRTVASGGMFGQPKGERKHCVSFAKGIATDNANTFFGNHPESAPYQVSENKVSFGFSEYVISADGTYLATIKGSALAGTILVLQ